MSPNESWLSESLSVYVDVFTASKEASSEIITSVGSLVIFPSVSSPSSLASETSVEELPGFRAETTAVFLNPPESIASWEIVKVAV